uniref:Uncharacterized protein n=1 Tax=Tanacetum cinerariifolium TaxID=118510 RepID=A0A6L2NZL6_TANCI|nr:hypothetical protein [Tanacetum cinerariifolium]
MAELDEIKLLLRQQSNAFQAKMAALQADLQATKGLNQVGHYGGGATLGDAFSLARITEAHLRDKGVSSVSNMAIVEYADANQGNSEDQGDALESGDISILNSLVGYGSPRSLQLWGTIGSVVEADLYVLSMKGPDVVLGIQWLQKFGKVTRLCGADNEIHT